MKHRLNDSPIWYDLLKIKNIYLQGRGLSIGNGNLTRFWLDKWLYDKPLNEICPVLFELCENKNIIVAKALEGNQITFRRWLHSELRIVWETIWRDASNFRLSTENDRVIWHLGKKGTFTVKSIYNALSCSSYDVCYRKIWRGKIPEKIKIFLWLLSKGAILTRDNLLRRKWKGEPCCVFCDKDETIDHLFFQCPVAKAIWLVVAQCFGASNIPMNLQQCWLWCKRWLPYGEKFHPLGIGAICWAIWKCRNRAVFDKKLIKSPLEIVCHACALMKYWVGLFADMDQDQLVEGANTMLRVAKEILATQTARQVDHLLLQDVEHADQDEDPKKEI